jgi:hypothetical protein
MSMDGDVVLLSMFGGRWLITAVGVPPTRRPPLRLHPQGKLNDADRVLELAIGPSGRHSPGEPDLAHSPHPVPHPGIKAATLV